MRSTFIIILSFCCQLAVLSLYPEVSRSQEPSAADNASLGPLVLYTFDDVKDGVISDVSGTEPQLDLLIEEGSQAEVRKGVLRVTGKSFIVSRENTARIAREIQATQELTLEVWITPENERQEGPARIVTISKNPNERNLTLGQEFDRYDVRLRTSRTTTNGMPSLTTRGKVVNPRRRQHLTYTRDRSGQVRIFLNGQLAADGTISGSMDTWDRSFRLALGNELSGDRVWRGEIHRVALYAHAFSPQDVMRHFDAGPDVDVHRMSVKPVDPNARLFETEVARIFSNHCLECHDAATHKGGLDLSRKATVFGESDSGRTLIPGKLEQSDLWAYIESDEMPKDRPALSDQEKATLKQWITGGAKWTLETIDPALYQHANDGVRTFVRRLTVEEFIETVRVVFDVDIANEARELLPPDLRADGFTNTGYNLTVDLGHVDALAQLAPLIVERMEIAPFARRYTKGRQLTDDNMRKLVQEMGRWVLRGPLEAHEIDLYRGISTTVASAGGTFDEAVNYILQAMIQSPRFMYLVEREPTSGKSQFVSSYELANRLSYILWGGPPDRELLDAAERYELVDKEQLHQHVGRMLQDSRARQHSRQFISQWLNLNSLNSLRPDAELYPDWNPRLADQMREETIRFFEEVVWEQQRPITDLLNAQVTFLAPELAKHYGLNPQGEQLTRYDLQDVPSRGGLLTQGSVLTIGGDEASMVTRGLFVLNDLLRGTVKDPPPCVDTTPIPTKSGQTNRDISEMRLKNVACGGCHARFEPLAFGLEKFDGLGSFREKDEHGNKLREDGNLLIPGTSEAVSYKTSAEMMDLLAQNDRVRESLVWKVTQFSLGRPLLPADAASLKEIDQQTVKNGGTYQALLAAITMSDLVRKSAPVPQTGTKEIP